MEPNKPKPLLNKAELKAIKRSRTKLGGKKVLTDDVRKLKSLKITPDLTELEAIDFYREPIWIEYYIPKESRFAFEQKYLYIYLVDPSPRGNGMDALLEAAISEKRIVDVWEFYELHPEHKEKIEKSYWNTLPLLEHISRIINNYKKNGEPNELKDACYLTETLLKTEPTLASLELFGEYGIYNLNWFIRHLNKHRIQFSLEDTTISLLIKRRNEFWESHSLAEDPDFELFVALFYEQAFPHRGATELTAEDFLLD